MNKQKIKLGIPKGSLEEKTIELFAKAGYRITGHKRSYFPKIDDPEIEVIMAKVQELPRYVERGIFDIGLCGKDWVLETGVNVVELCELVYSKKTFEPARWVLAVLQDSSINEPEDLEGKIIATELVNITKKYLLNKNIDAIVEFSWGATEAKPPLLANGIVELTETGETIEKNKLKIIDTVFSSVPILIANSDSLKNPWKKEKIEKIMFSLKEALESYGVWLKEKGYMNWRSFHY